MSSATTQQPRSLPRESGFSVLELLIVVAMMLAITGFAVVQIAQARQNMARTTTALEFITHLEKARQDSVRRHPDDPREMSYMTIINKRYYSVSLDTNQDGRLEPPRVVSLPTESDVSFNGPFPRTIFFNWRGQTVDESNLVVTPAAVIIGNSYGSTVVSITSAGTATIMKSK